MRYKILYILAFLLCANSLFLQIESPIITIGDKWYASIILLLLFLIIFCYPKLMLPLIVI